MLHVIHTGVLHYPRGGISTYHTGYFDPTSCFNPKNSETLYFRAFKKCRFFEGIGISFEVLKYKGRLWDT